MSEQMEAAQDIIDQFNNQIDYMLNFDISETPGMKFITRFREQLVKGGFSTTEATDIIKSANIDIGEGIEDEVIDYLVTELAAIYVKLKEGLINYENGEFLFEETKGTFDINFGYQ